MTRSPSLREDVEAGVPSEDSEAIPLQPLRAPLEVQVLLHDVPAPAASGESSSSADDSSDSVEWSWSFPRWSIPEEQPECSSDVGPSGAIESAAGRGDPEPPGEDSTEASGLSPLWKDTLDSLLGIQRIDKPLWAAVKAKDPQAVREALAACAPLAAHLPVCTLLHWCVENYTIRQQQYETVKSSNEMEIIFELLDWTKPLELNCLEHEDVSLLYLAIGWGSLELVQDLLSRGADVHKLSIRNETALHAAARYRHPHILKYLLDNYHIDNTLDRIGMAAIHCAVDDVESMKLLLEKFGEEQLSWLNREEYTATAWHYVGTRDSFKVAEFLFRSPYREGLLKANADGETPLYATASKGIQRVTALLLRCGAFLTDRANNGKTVVEEIATNFTDPLKFLEDTFDEFIEEEDKVITVSYSVLADHENEDFSQIDVLKELIRCGLSKILMHPLIESMLYLRWKCLLPVFYTILAIYAAFLIPFNIYLVMAFYKRDTASSDCSASTTLEAPCVGCLDDWCSWLLITLIYSSLCLMLTLEFMYIYLQKLGYFKHAESWVKLCVLGLGAAVPALARCPGSPWRRHVACAALLLAWLQALLLLSRFPGWGYYVLMFERVAINMLKVFLTSVCLVFGFSLCFMIQYHATPPFDDPVASFVKTLVMMSSEFDYEDLFGEDHDIALKDSKMAVRLLFVVFVIFIAIVLMNFMIGVAVSDINELVVIGNVRRLEMQVELLSHLERLGHTALGNWFKMLRIRYHAAIVKTLEFLDNWFIIYLNPDLEPDEVTGSLTTELKDAIVNVIRKKKKSIEENKVKQGMEDKLNALHNAVVGTHSEKKTENVSQKNEPYEKLPDPILIQKINSLESALSEMVKAHEELNRKIDDLTNCMNHLKPARESSCS